MLRNRFSSAAAVLAAGLVLGSVLSCADSEAADRAAALASPSAHRFSGTWQASFTLDRRESMTRFSEDTTPVSGTIVIAEDNHGIVAAREMDSPTHDGAYDIDFSQFGFSTRSGGSFPAVIARVFQPDSRVAGPWLDSIAIILSPGSSMFTVRMTGRLARDSITGEWSASGYRSAGALGTFTMRRVRVR